jgi:hypothetical protein
MRGMSDIFQTPSNLPQEHHFEHHPYDRFMKGKSVNAFRLSDPHHSNVNIGDIVSVHGGPDVLMRQKFQVVAKTEHPTIEQAVKNIQHSSLSARDKVQMTRDFRNFHGMAPQQHSGPVVHFQFNPTGGGPHKI